MAHARSIAERELDAAIDNPILPAGGWKLRQRAPVAFVATSSQIAVSELAAISERRTDRTLLDVATLPRPPAVSSPPTPA
ncbi:MAG: hypothetical protein R2713_20830 [Ilumatobacteraceae bacterium]